MVSLMVKGFRFERVGQLVDKIEWLIERVTELTCRMQLRTRFFELYAIVLYQMPARKAGNRVMACLCAELGAGDGGNCKAAYNAGGDGKQRVEFKINQLAVHTQVSRPVLSYLKASPKNGGYWASFAPPAARRPHPSWRWRTYGSFCSANNNEQGGL